MINSTTKSMNQELRDEKVKVVNLTRYLRKLPSTANASFTIIILSIIVGIIGYLILTRDLSLTRILWAGSLMGLIFLGFPSIITAFVTNAMTKKTKRRIKLKEATYFSLAGMLVASLFYIMGTLFALTDPLLLIDLMIFAYALIFLIRMIGVIITTPFGLIKSMPIATLHPIIGHTFIFIATTFNTVYSIIPFPPIDPIIVLIKSGIGLAIMIAATLLLIKAINAPMKKNFGVKTTTLVKAFLGHIINKTLSIEEKLAPTTEKINALIGIIAFKTNKKIKALMIIPYLHPGPFAEIGGAKLAKELSKIDEDIGTTTLVAHGTATHDLNPMRTNDLQKIRKEILGKIKKMNYSKQISKFETVNEKGVTMTGLALGKNVFFCSSLSPKATEDIDFSIGQNIMSKMEKDFEKAIYVDAHNCHHSGHHTIYSGDPITSDLEAASKKLRKELLKSKKLKFKIGVSKVKIKNYIEADGIGTAGIRTIVFQTNGTLNAYVIVDGNNIKAGVREKLIKEIKKQGIDEVEIMTTDSHTVNNVQGVHNPFGEKIPFNEIKETVNEGINKAIKDLEDAEVAFEKIKIPNIHVLGMQRASELVATINSIVSMLSIVGPLLLVSTTLISLLVILIIPW